MTTIDLSQPFSYRPATAAFASAAAILAGLAFVFIASNLLAPAFATGGWNLYFVQPLLWLGLAALCLRLAPDLLRRPPALILSVALLAGLFEVALFATAGLLYGFGRSTFAHEALPTLANLFYIGSALFGAETARAYLLRRWLHHGWPAVIVVALLFAALTLSLSQLQTLTQADAGSFTVVGGSFPARRGRQPPRDRARSGGRALGRHRLSSRPSPGRVALTRTAAAALDSLSPRRYPRRRHRADRAPARCRRHRLTRRQ